MTAREKEVRQYASRLALTIRKRGNILVLSERYGQKKKIGEFRSFAAVEWGIQRYGDKLIEKTDRQLRRGKPKKRS